MPENFHLRQKIFSRKKSYRFVLFMKPEIPLTKFSIALAEKNNFYFSLRTKPTVSLN